ncbi:alpha/beta fold hydrolase [Sorangium sp. So ce1014]|uniref:alpha/beta fold hydrolase n=1 Tax=Sorangium sp. So ce1014 TaxID=3133326 RepID=UPI003F61F096
MSLSFNIAESVGALLRAVGVVDVDGNLVGGWFQDPFTALGKLFTNPEQRAGLLALLDQLLPPPPRAAPAASRWYPLLDPGLPGNIYFTATGTVIGVAAELATPAGASPRVRAGLRLPILETDGVLVPIAGTAAGPLEIAVDVELDPPAAATAVRVRATVDLEPAATFSVRLEGVRAGGEPETLEISSAHVGADLIRVVEVLLRDALSHASGEPRVGLLVEHLFGALGLDGSLPRLPVEALASDPGQMRAWLAAIAGDPATLSVWFTHLAGLLGAAPPTAADPLAATLLSESGVALVLRASAAGGELHLALALEGRAAECSIEASVTLLAIPLAGGAPLRAVPGASVLVRAFGPTGVLVDAGTAVSVGSLAGGIRFDGVKLVPELVALGVVLDDTTYDRLDLTDATAVMGAAAAGLKDAIEEALGGAGPALALLGLLGVAPPASDPTSPHLLELAALGSDPTAAIAAVHRAALGDPSHGWSHLFGELATLLGLDTAITGTGIDADPWCARVAADGALALDLVAWNARAADTPAGEERLRLGLAASASVGLWSTRLQSELLAFDLPRDRPAAVRLIDDQRLSIALAPVPEAASAAGLELHADALRAVASWRPGARLSFEVRAEGLTVAADGHQVGPLTLTFPPGDPSAPDLGLGLSVAEGLKLLRLLARHALSAWGGEAVHALGELLGLYGDEGWPLLEPPDPADAWSLFERLGEAMRSRLRRVLLEVANDGVPHAERALASIAALLQNRAQSALDGATPWPDGRAAAGLGTYEIPWALPLVTEGGEGIEIVAWLEPDGPPSSWAALHAAEVAGAADAPALIALVPRIAAFLPELPAWIGSAPMGPALTRLAAWLAAGDGAVPLVSQLPVLPGWRHGIVLASPHAAQPRDPAAIAQIVDQLDAWADPAGRAVLLLGPAFSGRSIWDDLLAAAEPNPARIAHFDLRQADPRAAMIAAVTSVATHYTLDLDDDGRGDAGALADQIAAVVDRVLALTGRTQVLLVAHSTAGVAARVFAARRPELVRGVVTLGTPHAGGALAPLLDAELAEAVRAARALGGGAPSAAELAAALERLDASLAGVEGALAAAAFAGAPAGIVDSVPGFALGSALGGDLVAALAASLATRLSAAAGDPARRAPTDVGLGVRVRLPFPLSPDGALAAEASLRLDAGRVRLVAGAPEPARAPCAALVQVDLARPGGWIVGESAGVGPRIRSAELAVAVVATAGAVSAVPKLVFRDVALGGAARQDVRLDDPRAAAALAAICEEMAMPANRSPEEAVIALAAAVGIVELDEAGDPHPDAAAIGRLASAPVATVAARGDALLDALAGIVGGALEVPLASLPLTLSFDRATRRIHLRTTAEVTLSEGIAAEVEARIDAARLEFELDAALSIGAVRLAFAAADGTFTLSAPPWLAPLVLYPAPPPQALRRALAPVLPRFALSSALSVLLGALLETGGVVLPLDALFADPGAALAHLSGDELQALLESLSLALRGTAAPGLALPGGLLLSASGSTSLRLALAGSLGLGGGNTLVPGVTLEIDAAQRTVAVAAALTIDLTLPGTFGRTAIAFSAGPAGVGLVVTPAGSAPITLLPHFSGFGALVAAGTSTLLPHLLQAIVDELLPGGTSPQGVLRAALALATALEIYADDGDGFEAPARAAKLASMVQPGFFEQLASPGDLAGLLAGLFGPPPLLQPPLGSIARDGDRMVWVARLPGGANLRVELGWSGSGVPQIAVGVAALDLGPLVIEEIEGGYDGALVFALSLRLDPGADFAFLAPVFQLGVVGDRLSIELLPLGEAGRSQVALAFAPAPSLTFTEAGAFALLEKWGVPLVATLLLRALDAQLGEQLWSNGPTARGILEGAGLIRAGSNALAAPLPPAVDLVLGAAQALASGASIDITDTLELSVVNEAGRTGLVLRGYQDIVGEDLTATLHFGDADWLTEADGGGAALRLIRSAPGQAPPIAVAPGLAMVGLGVTVARTDGDPLVRGAVEVGAVGGLVFLDLELLDENGDPAVTVSRVGAALELDDARIVLSSDDGDGFIQQILPPELQAPFSLTVVAREGRALEVHGGIGNKPGEIELTFPIDLDLGIARIRELFLAARPRTGGEIALQAGLSGDAALGPVAMVVERVGLEALLGPAGVTFGFKAPSSLGLSLSTPTVSGGGYLSIDADAGQYTGVAELFVAKQFALTAIGILNTKLPGDVEGFSLLLLATLTVETGIQLGFGFTLKGLGGLIGVNRTMKVDAIEESVADGRIDSILFPKDVVKNAPKIISDIQSIFPPLQDQVVLGLMARIAWGTPALIKVDLGLIIELPDPIRIAILGRLSADLPTEDKALLVLRMKVVGVLDFAQRLFAIRADINDSRLLTFALTGGMAMRLRWGADAFFALAVGGFNPRFQPPPGFPELNRMGIVLFDEEDLELRAESYFALTPSTLQFGAAIDFSAKADTFIGKFSAAASLGLDALIQFSPFYFIVDVHGLVAIYLNDEPILTARLELSVEGPGRWHIWGFAAFHFLGAERRIPVDVSFGDQPEQDVLPRVAVRRLLREALSNPGSWSAQLPATGSTAFRLREVDLPGAVVVHPLGQLTFRQRVAPLDVGLEKFGEADIDGDRTLALTYSIGGRVQAAPQTVEDSFARGQFFHADAGQKLSQPEFERLTCGHTNIGQAGMTFDLGSRSRSCDYEVTLVDDPVAPPVLVVDAPALLSAAAASRSASPQGEAALLAERNAAARAARAVGVRERTYRTLVVGPDERMTVSKPTSFHRATEGHPGSAQVAVAHGVG